MSDKTDVTVESLFFGVNEEKKEVKTWKTKDGREIRICDMDDKHLLNTVRFLAAKYAEISLLGADAIAMNADIPGKARDLLADIYAKKRSIRLKEELSAMIKEAKRRKLTDWLKFGLSSAALEIINDAD